MEYAYRVVFAVGVLYTFVSFLISGISGIFHLGSHLGHMESHIHGGHGHPGAHAGSGSGDLNNHGLHVTNHAGGLADIFISWISILINPIVAVSFLTVFGGIGIMGGEYYNWGATEVFFAALTSGIIVAFLLYRFVSIPLYRSENSSDVSRDELIGKPAEIISPILDGGFGKIGYTVNSIRYTAPARHIDGKAVEQGTKAVICKIDNNIFYITEMSQF